MIGLALAAWGAAAGASASAAQFTVGTASSNSAQPAVALDQNGDAWVTWPAQQNASTYAVDVCEIPAGADSCGPIQQVASFPSISTYELRSSILLDAAQNALVLVIGDDVGNNEQLQVSQSTWNGTDYPAFPAPTQVGNVDPAGGGAALDASDGLVLTTADLNEALSAQGASLNETPPGETGSATLVYPSAGANIIYGSAISYDGQHLVAAWGSGLYPPGGPLSGGPLSYAYIDASSLSPATVNNPASWTQGTLDDGGSNPTLAGGPAGTFLAETIPGSPTGFLDLRSFTGSGFSAASPVYCSDAATYGAGVQSSPALAEDQSGRVHLAYIAGGSGGEDVRYVTLVDGNQSTPETLAHNPSSSTDLWENPAVSGTASSAIAVWIGDETDTVFASWLPGAMPATSGCAKPPATAATSTTAGGLTITVTTPATNVCVANGRRLTVSLTVSGKHPHAKFKSAQFFIDKGIKHVKKEHRRHETVKVTIYLPSATARRVPTTLQLPISGLSSGSHTLTVKLTLSERRRRHGRTVTALMIHKTVRAKFTVC